MNDQKQLISSKILFSAIKEQLAEHRQAVFTVTGMSMWPFLCHGRDQVIVEKAVREEIKKGDIVLLEPETDSYLLHRITKLSSHFFESTGDGNLVRDGIFPYDCIVAKVVTVIRNKRTIHLERWYVKLYAVIWMGLFPWRRKIFRFWSFLRPYVRRTK